MAYRRPLTLTQSIVIALLWLIFFILFCVNGKQTAFSWTAIVGSAFVVFYPIWKSYKQRKQ